MTKTELIDKYWHKYLIWCAKMPKGNDNELVFWLDHNRPTENDFWEWITRFRKELLK